MGYGGSPDIDVRDLRLTVGARTNIQIHPSFLDITERIIDKPEAQICYHAPLFGSPSI